MCGRFNVIDNPGLQALLRDLGIDLQLPAATKGGVNIAPTEPVLIARRIPAGGEAEEETSLETARWWLTPSWADEVSQKYAMFNARSETLARSPAFRGPFKRQRGVVPMSSFLEWRKEGATKQPWGITTEDNALAVAALWDVWEKGGAPLFPNSPGVSPPRIMRWQWPRSGTSGKKAERLCSQTALGYHHRG